MTSKIHQILKNSYDKRVVNYESVHQLTNSNFDLFVSTINPNEGETILDVGAGYGAATREMIIRNPNVPINYVLLEKSMVQLDRAKVELGNITTEDFINRQIDFLKGSIQKHPFDSEVFDKVVAKSFIHEIPKNEKTSSFRSIYKMLKSDGQFIIWNYILDDINCDYVRKLIRKKDELAGFDELVLERHFPTKKEIVDTLQAAGFKNIREEHTFTYTHHSFSRLGEFNNDLDVLRIFNKYLVKSAEKLDQTVKDHMKFNIQGDDITIEIEQSIYKAEKD